MDLWVVAVAAGAGFVAKNLQNLSVDKKGGIIPSSYNYQSEPKNFLQQFRDKTCPLRRLAEDGILDESFLEMDNTFDARVSESDELGFRNWKLGEASRSDDDCNLSWVSTLPCVFSKEGSLEFEGSKNMNMSSVKRGRSVRDRGRRFRQNWGLNSIGTGLDVQDCNDHHTVEDNPCLYHPSTSPVRPVLVTDWSSTVERSAYSGDEFQRKAKRGPDNSQQRDSGEGIINSQGHSTMLLFITGLIVGILSATTEWKAEADKLNKVLNQMQSLVQDLQEELEMKDMLMVKELPIESRRSPPGELPFEEPIASPSEVTKFDIFKASDKHAGSLELLSTIEAELQAELETLENNMNYVSTVDRISGVVELNPDFEPEIIRGDLKPALANAPSDSISESTNTTTGYSQPANYSVSPWELSLRLHELIESRLETRIKELETALTNTLNHFHVPNSNSGPVSERKFSRTESESSSSVRQSPSVDDYAEGYKEPNGNILRKEDKLVDVIRDVPCSSGKQTSISFVSNVDSESDNDDGADESEMQLIKRIVERRRSVSNFKIEIDGWG